MNQRRSSFLAAVLGVACATTALAQEAVPGAGPASGIAAPAPGTVEPIVSMRAGDGAKAPARKKSYDIKLKNSEWLDTGIDVAAGETLNFAATGEFTLGTRAVGPDGAERGFKDLLRIFPLNSAKAGELIGRVSSVEASYPFAIGAQNELTMPTSGRLFLRVNASDDLTAEGEFKVNVKPGRQATTASAAGSATDISKVISPAVFAGIPRRVTDQSGHAGDMINFALVGTQAQVESAFKAAGWVQLDKSVEDALVHGILSTLSHEAYTEMPMSTLYLFGRPQDLSFARGDPLKIAAERHHLRVWRTEIKVDGAPLWVGSATHDIGFETDQRNGNVTHRIDPNVDGERGFLLQSFDAAGAFSSAAYVTPADPVTSARTATGGEFSSDGRIAAMRLK
jgi:hypothetical protein